MAIDYQQIQPKIKEIGAGARTRTDFPDLGFDLLVIDSHACITASPG